LAQWADAAVELFPVHGEKFQEIARVLRVGVAQAAQEPVARSSTDTILWRLRQTRWHGTPFSKDAFEAADEIERLRGVAQAALDPGMREALERIRDFPIGGHTAAGAMALIARQALATGE
jgi:hypothetical protein